MNFCGPRTVLASDSICDTSNTNWKVLSLPGGFVSHCHKKEKSDFSRAIILLSLFYAHEPSLYRSKYIIFCLRNNNFISDDSISTIDWNLTAIYEALEAQPWKLFEKLQGLFTKATGFPKLPGKKILNHGWIIEVLLSKHRVCQTDSISSLKWDSKLC